MFGIACRRRSRAPPSRSDHPSRGRPKQKMKVIYTYTDEAPALATHSFLPIIEAYAGKAGVEVETRDISLAGRILAAFDLAPDSLAELGELAKTPAANIIKLPNISASIPQLKAAIKELQAAGYAVPDFPDDPGTDDERAARAATMSDGDFRHSERSVTVAEAGELRIEHVAADGTVTVLKPSVPVQAGEVVDAAVMRVE